MMIDRLRAWREAHVAMSPIGLNNVVDQESVENHDGEHGQQANEHDVDEQMVDVDEVVIAAERGHRHEHVHLAEHVHVHECALEKLRYRIDGGEQEERGNDTKSALASTIDSAEVGMTHVQVAIDGERKCEPHAQRLSGRHHRVDVD